MFGSRMAHQQAGGALSWTVTRTPKNHRKIFKPNPEKARARKERAEEQTATPAVERRKTGVRLNPLNIQMLSSSLHEQVFRNCRPMVYDANVVAACRRSLEKYEMVDVAPSSDGVELKLPPFEGANLEEHFAEIGRRQCEPYYALLEDILGDVPEEPDKWVFREGWTRYDGRGPPQKVDYPSEGALVFDVEVCMSNGKAPTLAVAVSSEAWYGWVSQTLVDGSCKPITNNEYGEEMLIPLESTRTEVNLDFFKKPKLIIGHNVSFDRARIKEQYWLKQTGARFLDTMSMHVCVSGLTSYQRAMMKSKKEDPDDDHWKELSSLNGLSEVHNLYCGGHLEKETRNLFTDGTIAEIQVQFQRVMKYCAGDVTGTHRVLRKLYPIFRERFPHPVTFSGMLELGTAYLPVNGNWSRYIEESELTYEELEHEGKVLLGKRADSACQLLEGERYKEDVWMWDQDWTVKTKRGVKGVKKRPTTKSVAVLKEDEEDIDVLELKYGHLFEVPVKTGHLLGYPEWYRKLCPRPQAADWTPGPHNISTGMQVTPKLLNLTWEGYPLHYIRGLGWGFLVPFDPDREDATVPLRQLVEKCPLPLVKGTTGMGNVVDLNRQVEADLSRKDYYRAVKKDKSGGMYKGSGIWCDQILDECVYFFKLPHKDGPSFRVGNPLAKDFLNKFSENVLASDSATAEQVLSIARQLSYWRNNRDRIRDQMVVWTGTNTGAILPQVVVSGTLTRRAVEPTWMTASNAHAERIGSELRAMIQAPDGHRFVGADVDSQELWIASVIGDAARAKMHGATPLGWMTLSGDKSQSTDMHSVTAKAVGISRDHAKVINYARIYGAGQNFAERLLRQFNPAMTDSEARSKAQKMFAMTKGKRFYRLRSEYHDVLDDVPYYKWRAFELAKLHGKRLDEMFEHPEWVDGTESAMFNRLEEIAGRLEPTTPFLSCRLSRALEPQQTSDDRFLPTRVNWVVQSGAVDFLHLMLVCMRWLLKDRARFCLSFHDEVRYMVPEEHKYRAALALHITNLLTRAFCSIRLGINELPQSVAFFSSVEVDKALRKECRQDCRTPSNPHGLELGYGIGHGESLDIHSAVKLAEGSKEDWYL